MSFFSEYDSYLTANEKRLVEKASLFCAGPFSDTVHQAYLRGEPWPAALVGDWAKEGFLGLQAKREDGGHEASFICKIRVAQEMAKHSFGVAFCLNNLQGNATRLSRFGSSRHRDEFLSKALCGQAIGAPAISEPGGGSDIGASTTIARPAEGGWTISGTKAWVTNGMLVDHVVLLASVGTQDGERAFANFIVKLDEERSVTRREILVPGARSFRLAEITFDDHFVPEWCLFNGPGEALKASLKSINAARVHVAAMCVATLYASLAEATHYAGQREVFGKPLMAHQGLRWSLAEVALRLEAANALVLKAAREIDGPDAIVLAAQAKVMAVDTAIWGVDACLRAMGAIGAASAHRLNMNLSEVRMAAFGDGTNEILLERIGRCLSDRYVLVGESEKTEGRNHA